MQGGALLCCGLIIANQLTDLIRNEMFCRNKSSRRSSVQGREEMGAQLKKGPMGRERLSWEQAQQKPPLHGEGKGQDLVTFRCNG